MADPDVASFDGEHFRRIALLHPNRLRQAGRRLNSRIVCGTGAALRRLRSLPTRILPRARLITIPRATLITR